MLESVWTPPNATLAGRYSLKLINRTNSAIEGFKLAISGPARVSEGAEIIGGRVVTQLSNYCELAPNPGFVLKPGASWTIDIGTLDYPLRHWTDGATTGFIIRSDGTAIAVLTAPTENNGTDKPRQRGTQRLPLIKEAPVSISVVP